MSVNRTTILSITCVICIWMHCIMGQDESCRTKYSDNCLANATLCEPYTVPSHSRCDYVRCCCSEYASEEAVFNYLFFQYCAIWSRSFGFSINAKEAVNAILLIISCIYFVLILGNVADKYFAPIMAETAETLGISHNIAGVTFLAFANGAPDISSSVAAITHGGEQTKLGFGALLGVAVFNPILISSVISTLAVSEPIKVVRFPYVRDCIFLFLAASCILKITLSGKIQLFESIIMICLYITYVTTAVISEIYNKKKNKPLHVSLKGHGGKYKSLESFGYLGDKVDADQYHPSAKHLYASIKHEELEAKEEADNEEEINKKQKRTKKQWCFKILWIIIRGPTILVNFICRITIVLTDDEHWQDWLAVITCTTAPMWFFFVFELFEVELLSIPLWILVLICGVIMSAVTYYLCRKKYKSGKNNDVEISLEILDAEPKLSASMSPRDKLSGDNEKLESQAVMKHFFLLLGFLSSVAWINFAAVEVVNILSVLGVVASIDLAILGLTVLAWGNSTPDLVADVGVSRRGYAKMGIAAAIGGPTLDVLIGVGLGTTIVCLEQGGEAEIPISTNIFLGCIGVMTGITFYSVSVGFNEWTLNKYIGYCLFFYYVTFLSVNIISYQTNVTIV